MNRLHAEHAAYLQHRYASALAAAGFDAVVLHSGSLQKKSEFDDAYWPLRVVPHFAHWLPLAEPDCALVIRPGRTPRLVRPRITSFWEKPAPPEDGVLDVVEVVEVDRPEDAKDHFGGGRVAFIGQDMARAQSWGFSPEVVTPAGLMKELDLLRTIKTPYEVACLAEANRRASLGHEAVRSAFLDGGASELELHLLYLRATGQDDPETPYKNVVALGANAATLHHVSYGRVPTSRGVESLLLDAGATCRGYASDITRTWSRGTGATASAFASLLAAVNTLQQRMCGAVRVGLPYEQLHDESHWHVGTALREVGVLRVSVDEAVGSGITRVFFPHGLGHSLGLQTHDVGCAVVAPRPDNPFLRNTSIIAEGQVFTIEPGIYFIERLLTPLRQGAQAAAIDWALVDALAELGGIRIEDDVVVTAAADQPPIRNLTREVLPR